jgi:organic hydroperoxide reductase OsmC/OhrA
VTTATIRRYEANARTTDVFGRVLCNARDQYFISDGPIWNGCPGEATTPGEFFMAAVAACGAELIQVIAREQGVVGLEAVQVAIVGELDPAHPVRTDVTVFATVRVQAELTGVSQAQGEDLVTRFRARCPLFGSVAASAREVLVEVHTHAA